MANARTRYDTISEFMQREHDATGALLYAKPSVQINGTPFLFYTNTGMAFRLSAKARDYALALPGSTVWSPLGAAQASSPWVLVPASQFLRWDRLAIDALRHAEAGDTRRPQALPSQGPPPLPPAAHRWRDSIKNLMEKASALRLVR
ncbi:hypothetical protein [Tahibacter amnicola]|uniref:YjbR protein n=1 Tax=Tahibacter amnicola TaxID=2976241 RepID=A0ABY6BFY1_9GAMM|nr:hypothetical protein [Tahibacter amnicola]UXI68000.1 hypothetical protein N4264_25280 [Tahibacter amnicola]